MLLGDPGIWGGWGGGCEEELWLLFLEDLGSNLSIVSQDGGGPLGWASAFGCWRQWLGSRVGFPPWRGTWDLNQEQNSTSLAVGGGVSWVETCEVPAKALF